MSSPNQNSQSQGGHDDGSIIVYGDFTSPNRRWSLSQVSVRNSGNRWSPHHGPPHQNETAHSPSHLLRRQDRRMRHRAWRQIQKQEAEGFLEENRFDDEEDLRPQNDPFASLDSLMDQLSQEKREKQQQEQEEDAMEIDRDPDPTKTNDSLQNNEKRKQMIRHEERKKSRLSKSRRESPGCNTVTAQQVADIEVQPGNDSDTQPYIAPSPPDFDVCVHNDHDYSDDEEKDAPQDTVDATTTQSTAIQPRSSLPSHRRTTRTKKRSMLSTNTRRPQARRKESRKDEFTVNDSDSPPSTVTVEKVKSLVGLRPSNWIRSSNEAATSKKRQRALTSRSLSPNRAVKLSVLAAATRKPLSAQTRRPKNANDTKEPQGREPTSQTASGTETRIKENETRKGGNDAKVNVTFVPSFVPPGKTTSPSAASIAPVDTLFEDPTREEDYVMNIQNPQAGYVPAFFSSPQPTMKRRRAAKATGKWGKRFMSIRSSRSSDAVRLQNQVYARNSGMDLNNPRKRANRLTDVTLMGFYQGPWELPEECSITILGHIHSHTQITAEPSNYNQPINLRKQKVLTVTHQNKFAWISFKLSTARTIELNRGCRLRIYNAVVLPSPRAIVLDLPEAVLGSNGAKKDNTCETIVVCTDLCERLDTTTTA